MKNPDQNQLSLFSTPFEQNLDPNNRWVLLSKSIPWELLISVYERSLKTGKGSGNEIPARIAIGALLIKHKLNISDREVVAQIKENIYLQFFIGLSSFSTEAPFDPSSLVYFRSRFDWEQLQEVIEKLALDAEINQQKEKQAKNIDSDDNGDIDSGDGDDILSESKDALIANEGLMIIDSTVMPQDISFPTDVKLINAAREKSEEILDCLSKKSGLRKPRTYRKIANKVYTAFSMKRKASKKAIRKQIKRSLQYLKRNLKYIDKMMDESGLSLADLLSFSMHRYLLIIREIYRQQSEMFQNKTIRCDNRIVNMHQPHVRPIKRGKSRAETEFGAKICSFIDHHGFRHIHRLGWDATHDGEDLISAAERFKKVFGYYPMEIKADKQYRTRANRNWCKQNGIKMSGRGPGRPRAGEAVEKETPGERNAIEGTFGNLKRHYGLQRVAAKLKQTSEAWIAIAFLVLNCTSLFLCTFLVLVFAVYILIKYIIINQELSFIAQHFQAKSKIDIINI